MKKAQFLSLFLVVFSVLPGVTLAQTQYTYPFPITDFYFPGYLELNNMGGGARAAGMGGAFLGVAEGEMAFSWNPAAMIWAEKPSMGVQFISVSDELGDVGIRMETDGSVVYEKTQVKGQRSPVNLGGFNVPFNFIGRKWAAGGGYRQIFQMNLEADYPGDFGGTNRFTQNNSIDAITFSVAHEILPGMLSLGANSNLYIRGPEVNFILANAFPFDDGTDIDTIDLWLNSNSHYSGVNFDLGLSAKYSIFSGSFVLHTPFDLKNDIKQTMYFVIPPIPIGVLDRVDATTNIPLGLSAGIAAEPLEKLTLAFDFNARDAKDMETTLDFEQTIYDDLKSAHDWPNLQQIRVGAEYVLDAGFADIPLRAGFRNMPSVQKEYLGNGSDPEFGDFKTANLMTFGSGLTFERAWVDFAYQFGSRKNIAILVNDGVRETVELKDSYSRLYVSAGMFF
jgi:hypothetical protein